jgi:hypothetical protein
LATAKARVNANETEQEANKYRKQVHQHSGSTSNKRHKPITAKQTVLAASSATAKDEAKAAELKKQGITPVQLPKTPYRPKEKSVYTKPDYIPPEDNEDWTCLYKPMGNVIHRHKKALPPRNDIITYDGAKHKAQFNRNIQWRSTPKELQPKIESIIKHFWDVFDETGYPDQPKVSHFISTPETSSRSLSRVLATEHTRPESSTTSSRH